MKESKFNIDDFVIAISEYGKEIVGEVVGKVLDDNEWLYDIESIDESVGRFARKERFCATLIPDGEMEYGEKRPQINTKLTDNEYDEIWKTFRHQYLCQDYVDDENEIAQFKKVRAVMRYLFGERIFADLDYYYKKGGNTLIRFRTM